MQPATMTYILQCSSCGVRGEIGEYTETYVCPKCQGEMKLSEARISGDDPLIDALLDQMINKAERGDVPSKKSLAFLADSTNEHTRVSLENAWYRKKYPEQYKSSRLNKTSPSAPAQEMMPTSSSQTSNLPNGHRISSQNLPPRNVVHPNGLETINGDMLPPLQLSLDKIILNNKMVNNMKDKILVEIQSNYEIRGQITAFETEADVKTRDLFKPHEVRLLADLECDSSVGNPPVKMFVYDEDGDIIARADSYIQSLCDYGSCNIRLPEYKHAKKMVLRTKK